MPVPREVTQAILDRLSAATLRHLPDQSYTVGDRLEERAAAHPEKALVLFEDRVVGYGAANVYANRVAHAARALGLRRGDVAALVMENRPEFLTTWMGLAKVGVTVALLNTSARGRGFEHALATAEPKLVVIGSECLGAFESLDAAAQRRFPFYVTSDSDAPAPRSAATGDWDALLARADTENPDRAVRDDLRAGDDLFLIYTSGTTGLPKAARLSHMRWLGVGDGMSAVAGYGPDDVIGCVLPLYHGAGGMVVISSALAQGATVWLARRFSASRFWDDVRRYGVTGFQYVGEICRYLVNQPERPGEREHPVRVMMGAGMGRDVWGEFARRFGVARILEGWSSTEANTSLMNVDNRIGSCGRIPFPERHNGRLVRYDLERDEHPRDANGCILCAPGEVGEFLGAIPDLPNSGAGRFEGYTDAAATERKILRDVFQKGDRWYRSGDLLRCDEDGYFYFVDRIGDTYRWKSENVSTQEVAEALGGFPGLEIANVYGVRVPGAEGRAGMAALVLRNRDSFDGAAFFAWVEARLPAYAAPLFVRLVAEPDVTSTFKLRKVDLQREGYDPALVRDPLFVRDPAARAYLPLDAASLARQQLG